MSSLSLASLGLAALQLSQGYSDFDLVPFGNHHLDLGAMGLGVLFTLVISDPSLRLLGSAYIEVDFRASIRQIRTGRHG